ncbi:MAG: hypothetical protein EPO08_15685 [Rhodospirillaceae bacterium]|nr:MAG: hypothetical protein EPO08_15685 [Rhodospirillaceae bacterium]
MPATSNDPWSAFDTIAPEYGTANWQNLVANSPITQGILGPISPEVQRQIDIGSRAAAIYGETGALRPQLIDPNKSANDPNNWDPDSAEQLHQARTNLAAMYGTVNPHMKPKLPDDLSNPAQKQQWVLAMKAAQDSMDTKLDPSLLNMAMHQDGIGPPVVQKWINTGLSPSLQMGPFVNPVPASLDSVNKGKAIAKGPRAFIDFYGKN